jgi:hypothetical protein
VYIPKASELKYELEGLGREEHGGLHGEIKFRALPEGETSVVVCGLNVNKKEQN